MDTLSLRPSDIDYHGITLRVVLLEINGQTVFDQAAPFDASTTSIYSTICKECFASTNGGIASCGNPDIAVRRHDDVVSWYIVDPDFVPPNVAPNQIWSFLRKDYERVLQNNASSLPDFTSEEIQTLLGRNSLFPSEMGLYTIPDLDDDPQGRKFLDSVDRVVTAGRFEITNTPASYFSVRVGIETTGVPECVVAIGMIDKLCSIRFVENPRFPLWLTSNEVQARMTHYTA
jgi:hypothetical protein